MPAVDARYHDAHTHLSAGAADLLGLDLRRMHSARFIASLVAEAAARAGAGAWVRGWGWDGSTAIADENPGCPVFIGRRDGHAAWVNRAARKALGLSPFQSVVAEEAFEAARTGLPKLSTAERLAAVESHMDELALSGVAAVDDMVEPWGPEIYARLRNRGARFREIGLWLPESMPESEAEAVLREFPQGGRIVVRGIKLFLDGTLGARTAALWAPYADDPETAGALRIPEEELDERVARWARRGFPVAIHALGDRAVTLALDVLERVPRSALGPHRIEHAQVVRRSDLPRFAAGHIVASVQPGHWLDDRSWLGLRLGHRPEVVVHPLASFARAGATMMFGSDWPVSDWDPAWILAAATDPRRDAEAVSAVDASAWYTSGPR
jgi:predicted amidohydrolase YtcJ